MFGLEIHSLPAVLILMSVLGWVGFLVWRAIARLLEVSRFERGPAPERAQPTEYGLRQAERGRAGQTAQ